MASPYRVVKQTKVSNATSSTSKTTGALLVDGGIASKENIYLGGYLGITGTTNTVSVKVQAGTGAYNYNLPTSSGASGEILTSGGGSSTAMTWSGITGTGNVVMSVSPTITGTLSAAAITTSGLITANAGISQISNVNGAGSTSTVQNTNAGSGAHSIVTITNDTATGLVMFINSTTRSTDGGTNGASIRNDAGTLTLGSATYNTLMPGTLKITGNINNSSGRPILTQSGSVIKTYWAGNGTSSPGYTTSQSLQTLNVALTNSSNSLLISASVQAERTNGTDADYITVSIRQATNVLQTVGNAVCYRADVNERNSGSSTYLYAPGTTSSIAYDLYTDYTNANASNFNYYVFTLSIQEIAA